MKEDEKFPKTPEGQQQRWTAEFEAADRMLEKWHEQSGKVIDRYLDKRTSMNDHLTKLNLFHSNITTLRSMLYGRMPRVEMDRKYADPDDDQARVGADILERMLNYGIEEPGDDFNSVLRYSLDDRLLTGFGTARVRYDFKSEKTILPAQYDEFGNELAPEVEDEQITDEFAPIDYVHWRDFKWSYGRVWNDLRWVAFRAYMSFEEAAERFGEKKAKKLNYKSITPRGEKAGEDEKYDARTKAEVWEIWCKDDGGYVYWWSEGQDAILDEREDPMGLKQFFPCPLPMVANCSTEAFIPKPDYIIAQDLYREIDELENRITTLTESVKLVGVYDKNHEGLKRMINEGCEADLIPVDNWAAYAEKGGLKGAVDWLPIDVVVNVIQTLSEVRDSKINLLYQVTGMADILRGAGDARESATATETKSKWASVRVQALQDDFARFASDLMRLRAEVICKHFQPETIVAKSNIQNTANIQLLEPALELIKGDADKLWSRVVVRPESVAMVDYAQLKAERTEYLTALATFLQSAKPMAEAIPSAAPMLFQLLKWGLAGFKGSAQMETVVDQAIAAMQQDMAKPKPNPDQIKAQGEAQKHQFKMQELMAKHAQEMQKLNQQHQMELERLMRETDSAVTKEMAQLVFEPPKEPRGDSK